jgi:hypothetical protein
MTIKLAVDELDATTLVGALTGNVTGTASDVANAAVIAKLLTAYVSGAGTVAATDSILAAIQKLNGNDAAKLPLAGGTMSGTLAAGGNLVTTPKLQAYTETVQAPSIASNVLTLDLSTGNVFRVAVGANITTLTLTNVPATGQLAEFTLILDYSGPYTLTLPSSFKHISGGSAPAAGANSTTDTLTGYTTNGGTRWTYNIAQGATT